MSSKASAALTAIVLLILVVSVPVLRELWIIVILKALPSFFTLGLTTVILYKAFRYPRGTIFSLLSLLQLLIALWLIWLSFKSGLAWLGITILFTSLIVGQKSSKVLWTKLGVDKYYRS